MSKKRRSQGEGTVYYHKASGRWCAEATIDGRRYGPVYGKNPKETTMRLNELKVEHATGKLVKPSKMTVAKLLWDWLEVVRPNIAEKTYVSYCSAIHRHIASRSGARKEGSNSRLGKTRLARVEPAQVQGLLSAMESSGCHTRIRQVVLVVLHQAFKWAVYPNRWLRYNPCEGVPRPKEESPEIRALTEGEAAALLRATSGERLKALYVLALMTGMRLGELLALQWSDVDLKNAKIKVENTLQEVGRLVRKPKLKNPKSRRTVDLAPPAVSALKEHKQEMLAEGHHRPEDFIFCKRDTGAPLRQRWVTAKSFQPLLKRAELPIIHFHQLRHTVGTQLLADGVPIPVVQELLGHAKPSTTMNYYAHSLPGMHKNAVARLGERFSGRRR